jgi:hypothetical protein
MSTDRVHDRRMATHGVDKAAATRRPEPRHGRPATPVRGGGLIP